MMSTRFALVTGGASGIGRATCIALAESGLSVAVADINEAGAKDVAGGLGRQAIALGLDVTSSTSVASALSSAISQVGPVDVLVNCAGADIIKPFVQSAEDEWERLVALNLMGVFRTTHAVLPGMIERKSGRVISIASDAGRVGSSGEAVYAGCKGGVIAFTKSVAREVARYGVTMNCVAPGPTDTPPLRRTIDEGGEKLIDALTKAIPMRRLGTPEDVAGAVAYLAGETAGFVTGQTISVSGGLTMV
jgi:2-hydroxycyclohexanecarboxyl-CoA dehydrogenase